MKREYGLYDRVDFGKKHQGKTIEEVIQDDPEWLQFCIDNNYLLLSNEAYQVYSERV